LYYYSYNNNTCQGNPTSETGAPLYPKKKKGKKEEETTAPLCCIIMSSIHVKEIITQPEMDFVAIMSNALESHPNYKLQNKSSI